MFIKKFLLILIIALIASGGIYYWRKSKTNFEKTYENFINSQNIERFFAKDAKIDYKLLDSDQKLKQSFKDDLKSAQIYSRTSDQIFMYWKDGKTGYSSPVIWQKIKGKWQIISL